MKGALLIALSACSLFVITTAARPQLCNLPKVVGPCRAAIKSWYFDASRGYCDRFIYGGCQGNENRFSSFSKCQAMCGDDYDYGAIPYSASSGYSQSGYIRKYECTNYACTTCRVVSKERVNFGTCERDGSKYQQHACHGGSFLMSDTFDNAQCDGRPDTTIISGMCERKGDYDNEIWFKYDCYVVPGGYRSSVDDETESSNMDVAVVVAVLLIVAVIGMIGGYLVYRKRKKSAELMVLLDEDKNASIVAA